MEIMVKKIIRPLDLAAFAEEHAGVQVKVWANPTRAFRQERNALLTEFGEKVAERKSPEPGPKEKDYKAWSADWEKRFTAWFVQLWSQDPDPATHWTVEQVNALEDQDPRLVQWMTEASLQLLVDFGTLQKKA
jgi:hypothetical protein